MTVSDPTAWFCVRSLPKHEQIATAHLKKLEDIQVFHPRVRFKRISGRRSVWVTEALFPGYLFARFDWQISQRRVQYAPGVSGLVHFGRNFPVIPDEVITGLRETLGTEDLHTISAAVAPGDTVQVADGILHGLRAVVTQVIPSRDRIAVLMDLLGRQTTVELMAHSIVKEGPERASFLSGPRSFV